MQAKPLGHLLARCLVQASQSILLLVPLPMIRLTIIILVFPPFHLEQAQSL